MRHCLHSTPNTFPLSIMNAVSVPQDIARMIVKLIPHHTTLKALATVCLSFVSPCQEVLFQKLVIDFRRRNLKDHVRNMHAFLTAHPYLRRYIYHLEIIDNSTPFAHMRDTPVPLLEPATQELYSSSEMWHNRSIYAFLFEEHSLFPKLLNYLVKLSSIFISIKNIQFSWRQLTPDVKNSLLRLFQRPDLHQLYLQGLKSIPVPALLEFQDLKELYLKECDMDLVSYDNPIATTDFGNREETQVMRRLEALTIQELPASSFQVLLNLWKNNVNPAFIDMSSPRGLTIYISTFRELLFVESLFEMCQGVIETLTVHTWGLHLGTTYVPPSPIELGVPSVYPHYDWFYHAMGPLKLTYPRRLVKLTLNVSFWRNMEMLEANGELEWALQVLIEMPQDNILKEIIVNIRVGGGQLAFVDFQRYCGWRNWENELKTTTTKWSGVETILFLVCSDCGPRLSEEKADIQSVIAKQMPSLMASGKLCVGHALLSSEGLIDHDIVRWV